MFWRFIGTRGVVVLLIALIGFGYWWEHRPQLKPVGIAYISDRDVTLWNTLAQVRQPVAEMHYGERVDVIRHEGAAVQLRTASGTIGWLPDSREMMDSAIWQQGVELLARARTMPPQAHGRTKAVSNIRISPSRNGERIFQFPRGASVVVLSRQTADAPPTTDQPNAAAAAADSADQKPKQEDWLLVLSAENTPRPSQSAQQSSSAPATPQTPSSPNPVSNGDRVDPSLAPGILPATPIAGWVLARFVELDLPDAVKDYVSAADMHVVAWFELNRVPNGTGGEAPQYLVAASRGGEGQPCDFTLLRVYTWGAKRQRYETAYIESDLCGHLPIRVTTPAGMPEFRFADTSDSAADRVYAMRQTEVRRIKQAIAGSIPPHG